MKADKMRESTIFYASFYDAIKDLPEKNQLEVYNAIFELSLNGNEVELTGLSKTIFTLIRPQLIANLSKYENGCKGGRPKKKITESKPKNNLTETKPKPNVNENVNYNVNENVNDSITPTPFKGEMKNAQFEDYEHKKKISEGAYETWKIILKEYDIQLTEKELNALRGYTISKPNLPIHIIKANCITISNWIESGLDVSQGLLDSTQYKGLAQPRMLLIEDARGNRLNRDACIKKRQEQIKQENQKSI